MLYPRILTIDASPKAVSGRTSYYQTRLAFHSLPQVIQKDCTPYWFGPPPRFRKGSSCSWQARHASGPEYSMRTHNRIIFSTTIYNFGYKFVIAHRLISSYKPLRSPKFSRKIILFRYEKLLCCESIRAFNTRFRYAYAP